MKLPESSRRGLGFAFLRIGLALLLMASGGCATLGAGAPTTSADPELASQIDSILADTAFSHAHWGAAVVSLRTGETLYRKNADRVFLPASNQKLLIAAAALETLGPAYRFRTTISASGQLRDGVLRGDLMVRGSGDPTFSARFGENPRSAMLAWADSLRARGISRVEGGIVGVDSAFVGPPLGSGWAWDDLEYGFAAEYGALQFNDGAVTLRIVPSRTPGAPPIVVLDPPTQYVRIRNLAVTGSAGTTASISISRDPAGPGVTVEGSIPVDTAMVVTSLAVRDPTAYFLAVLREAVREAGVTVEGQALPAEEWPDDRVGVVEARLFTHESPPLSEILVGMMKPSQNQIAETLLLTVGREIGEEGSASAGVAVMDSLLRVWNLPATELRMADASGVSRYNLASPALFVGLLAHMDRSANREVWRATLPLAGVDGTLENRMREPPLRENVIAKTGTLSGVRALSGYLTTAGGEPIAFSFLVDHHLRSAAEADRVVEAALRAIALRP
jgi:D-alanyl-D-alanine carboxypeptidase/D-alanyl-D-alanine-endopeptidase (penicillin-binding protein 4)